MGLLDGGMATVFHGIFSGIYLDGQLYRPDAFADNGKGGGSADGSFGDPEDIKFQPEDTSQAMLATDGYVDTDKRYLVLAHQLAEPSTDCEMVAEGKRWSIFKCRRDPASSHYDLHCKFLRTVP